MRVVRMLVLCCLLVSGSASAHGGRYVGPADSWDGSSRASGWVCAPTNPAGHAAPGPIAVVQTTGRHKLLGSSRCFTSRGPVEEDSLDSLAAFDSWEFWWELEKESVLSRFRPPLTDAARASMQRAVFPVLLELAWTSEDPDILAASIVALGRSADATVSDQVVQAALPLLRHNELSVRTSAALALGILGSPVAVPSLMSLLHDDPEGRRLSGGEPVPWLVRALAALSLGLIDDPRSAPSLMDAFQQADDVDTDLKVCAVVALGLNQGDQSQEAVDFLLGLLGDENLHPIVVSYVPTALGNLGDRRALAPLLALFTARGQRPLLTQSAAIGLGQLGRVTDRAVIDALRVSIRTGEDATTCQFAMLALAEVGARDAEPARHEAVHDVISEQLVAGLQEMGAQGFRPKDRAWAALAAATYGAGQAARRQTLIDGLEAVYTAEEASSDHDWSSWGAFALALSLLEDEPFADQLLDDFKKQSDVSFRGHALVALGLLDHDAAWWPMLALCENKGTTPSLRLRAATGLALLDESKSRSAGLEGTKFANTSTMDTLIQTLETSRVKGVCATAAAALGLAGDPESIAPLLKLATDESAHVLARAYACVALGHLAQRVGPAWDVRLVEAGAGRNVHARTPAIAEVLDIR